MDELPCNGPGCLCGFFFFPVGSGGIMLSSCAHECESVRPSVCEHNISLSDWGKFNQICYFSALRDKDNWLDFSEVKGHGHDQSVCGGNSWRHKRRRHTHQRFVVLLLEWHVGMWWSSHSNSTTFELRTFSADAKFVEFFHVPIVEFEPQVYTIGTTCLHPPSTGTTNWTNARCLIVWKDRK